MEYELYVMTVGRCPDRHAYESDEEALNAAIEYLRYYGAEDFENFKAELLRRHNENPHNYGIEGLVTIRFWRD